MQINTEAEFMVYSWIKGTASAYLSRRAVFMPGISGGERYGRNFLHTLSKLALSPLRKTSQSP